MQKSLIVMVCLLALGFSSSLNAQIELEADASQVKKYMNTITAQELKDHLYILASDEYEGRETGTLGQKKAADYIARHFMDNGLVGPVKDNPNPYLQPINFYGRYVKTILFSSNNATLQIGKDFISRSVSDLELENAELVFFPIPIQTSPTNKLCTMGKLILWLSDNR